MFVTTTLFELLYELGVLGLLSELYISLSSCNTDECESSVILLSLSESPIKLEFNDVLKKGSRIGVFSFLFILGETSPSVLSTFSSNLIS